MIVFCEDCGSKNQLDPAQLKAGKAIFRCSSCNYLNSYQFLPVPETKISAMDLFCQEIAACPEIIGAFIFHSQKGVLNTHMPGNVKKADLNILGKILAENYLTCSSEYTDVTAMTLVLPGKNMITRQIKTDTFMILAARDCPLPPAIMTRLDRHGLS